MEQIDLQTLTQAMGQRAQKAAGILATAGSERKYAALIGAAEHIWRARADILKANAKDIEAGAQKGLSPAMMDRLRLDETRLQAIVDGVRTVAEQSDPVGEVMADWQRPSGLHIQRVRTPLGVIGVIFESRPNVTADAAALCLKSGNAAILRSGSDSLHSAIAVHKALVKGIKEAGLPADVVQLVPTTDRAAVSHMLSMTDYIDVIVPRGGKGLVARVQAEARVPVFAHLEGIVHIYIDKSANPQKALDVVLNAKTRRPGICGAAECLLIHQDIASTLGQDVVDMLMQAGVEVRAQGLKSNALANASDWGKEFLDMTIAAKTVNGVDAAIAHIKKYSSHHTECIIAEDQNAVERFFAQLDSAILMHNASTQFADGGEFGMGAEIGIATGKMHARGPVGAAQLTSFKYLVRGDGTIRK